MKIRVQFASLTFGLLALAAALAPAQAQDSRKSNIRESDLQELAKLEGDWVRPLQSPSALPTATSAQKITIKGDQWTWINPSINGAAPLVGTLKLKIDASQDPKHIDRTGASGSTSLGIYKLEGDTLTLCFDRDIKARPKEFKTEGSTSLIVLQRTGPASPTPPPSATPPATAARLMPPDVKAYMDARAIRDPERKIETLEKFLKDFPTSGYATTVKNDLVQTLIKTYSDQKEKLLEQFEKLIAATPETAKEDLFNNLAWDLFSAGVFLDEAERYATQSIALKDEQKFIEAQKRTAELRQLPAPSDDELKKRFLASQAHVQDTLAQIWLKQGKTVEGEKLLKEAFEANPMMSGTAAALADLALNKGDDSSALDYLATSVVVGRPPAGTQEKLESLYTKLHKDSAPGSVDKMLDDRYRKLFPTLPVAHYKATPERSDRTVLAEVFTGSACPPCVGADLAFDAMLERYSRKDLVVLMYHQHIPGPDPMANPSTLARWKFYPENRGVPSYLIDGERVAGGGGSRDMAQGFYDRVNPTVEQRLEAAANAHLSLSASLEGTNAKVKADVSQLKGDATDLKLQVALVEEMLSYSGENGIRLHPVVVRSLAGENAGGFAVDPAKPAAIEHTFDIGSITDELKKHLDDFESTAPGGRKFIQKKHAIDPTNLSVVAFLQDQSTKKILQAAYVRLKPGEVAAH